ncbi:MAG: hypothetical protein ACLRM8_02960 [Alistipes sp.]
MADRRNYRKQYKSGNKTRLGHAIYGGGLDYPNSVQPFWRITEGTGVFANNTYDYKLTVDGTEYKGQFKTGNGDVIPDGNMENTNLPCFTQNGSESSTFWGSGNNDQTPSLCTQITTEGNKYAVLQSKKQSLYWQQATCLPELLNIRAQD